MRRAVLLLALWCGAVAGAIKQPQFFARRDYGSGVGQGPNGFVVVADVNGDNIPDIIATTVGSPDIYTLLGNGNGTFRTGSTTIAGYSYSINDLVPVDLNGDGKIDLVIAGGPGGANTAAIGVCFGNGDGTFQPAVVYSVGDRFTGNLVVGDFNGDGRPDVVLVASAGIWMFTGKGGGVFNAGVLMPVSNIQFAILVAADFNGDGNLDLAIGLTLGPTGGFLVLFGNGNGTFQAPVTYSGSTYTRWLAVGDLNLDGHPDLVVGSSVYLNKGNGTFARPIAVDLPGQEFAIGDVNGDGIPDLVSSIGYVARGFGNGRFATPKYYPVESGDVSYNVVLADLRNKGLTDIVVGENTALSVLLNEGKGTFEDGVTTPLANSGNCGAAADFNGDGIPDLAVPTASGIVILFGTGKAISPYTTGPTISVSGPGCPITGDLNGDGIPDILAGSGSLGGIGAYLGNGDGTFRLASVVPSGPVINMVLGDFNHDGKPGLATSSNQLFLGNGDGTFQSPVPISSSPPPPGFDWIAAGDVNNDGWTDILATAGIDGAGLYVLLNNQNGGFTQSTVSVSGAEAVMIGDLNRDGNLDAVVMSELDTVSALLGDGKGGFTLSEQSIPYPGPDIIPPQVGDVNGDGIPDILLPANGSIGIALGKGDGTFVAPFAVGAGGGEGQILLQNQHGQSPTAGLPDLISPDGSEVWVLLNLTK